MPLIGGWDGPTERRDSVDKNLIRTITNRYDKEFESDLLNETQVSLLFTSDTGIYIGKSHPTQTDCVCVSIDTEEDNASEAPRKHWVIRLTYTNAIDNAASANSSSAGPSAGQTAHQQKARRPSERESDPLKRLFDVSFRGGLTKVFRRCDATGKLYANVVGDPYLPSLETENGAGHWMIGRNYAWGAFPNWTINAQGMVNSVPVIIPDAGVAYPAYSLKLGEIQIDPVLENGVQYWRAVFPLGVLGNFDHKGNFIGWLHEVPEMGKQEFKWPEGTPSEGRDFKKAMKVMIRDETSQPVSEPQFLNKWGEALNTKLDKWQDDVAYKMFQKFFTFDMNRLFA